MRTITINDPWTDDETIDVDDYGNQTIRATPETMAAHVGADAHDWMEAAKDTWENVVLPQAIADGSIIDRGPDFLADGHCSRYLYK